MMIRKSTIVKYFCTNDCRASGCPGHSLWVTHNTDTGGVSVYTDNEHIITFGESEWEAILECDKDLVFPTAKPKREIDNWVVRISDYPDGVVGWTEPDGSRVEMSLTEYREKFTPVAKVRSTSQTERLADGNITQRKGKVKKKS